MASVNPPKPQMASANPPQVAPAPPPSLYGGPVDTLASPSSAATLPFVSGGKQAPMTVNPYGTPTQAEWAAANPSQQAHQQFGGGWKQNLANIITASALGAAGGLKGNPSAGADWVAQGMARDAQVPGLNNQRYQQSVIQPLKDAASIADVQSQTEQRRAMGNKADTQSDSMAPFTMTAEQATAINHPELAGTQSTMRDYSKLLGMAGNNNTSSGNNTRTNTTKVTTTGMNNTTSTANNTANNKTKETVAEAADKTKSLIASMHDATSRANNANTNDHKGSAGNGSFKVPADVTKRAALASNVNENADAVDQLIAKRPDMLGAEGGRYTNVQQMIGSNDPDIHEMGVRMHNIALASNGAHGVRAAGAIQKTEDELFNNFKSGPQGIAGSLKATRGSMQTFLDDEKNFATTGQRTGGNNMVPPAQGGQSYKQTASGPGGHKIGSNDGGNTWFDAQTGKAIK